MIIPGIHDNTLVTAVLRPSIFFKHCFIRAAMIHTQTGVFNLWREREREREKEGGGGGGEGETEENNDSPQQPKLAIRLTSC